MFWGLYADFGVGRKCCVRARESPGQWPVLHSGQALAQELAARVSAVPASSHRWGDSARREESRGCHKQA